MPKKYTEIEDDILRELYSSTSNKDLALKLNRPISSIENRGNKLGLKKSKDYLRNMVNTPLVIAKEVIYVTQNYLIIPSKMNFN